MPRGVSLDEDDLFSYQWEQINNARPSVHGGNNESSESKRKTVLERLKTGPATCYEIDHLVHRGQAVVGTLRSHGHLISTELINGVDSYVWKGFEPQVKVTKSIQDAYYETQHWITTAKQRKELDGFQCRQCGAADKLETHHWRYRLFEESVEHDLITFCRRCHKNVHDAASGSSMHFPYSVSKSIADRIGVQ